MNRPSGQNLGWMHSVQAVLERASCNTTSLAPAWSAAKSVLPVPPQMPRRAAKPGGTRSRSSRRAGCQPQAVLLRYQRCSCRLRRHVAPCVGVLWQGRVVPPAGACAGAACCRWRRSQASCCPDATVNHRPAAADMGFGFVPTSANVQSLVRQLLAASYGDQRSTCHVTECCLVPSAHVCSVNTSLAGHAPNVLQSSYLHTSWLLNDYHWLCLVTAHLHAVARWLPLASPRAVNRRGGCDAALLLRRQGRISRGEGRSGGGAPRPAVRQLSGQLPRHSLPLSQTLLE